MAFSVSLDGDSHSLSSRPYAEYDGSQKFAYNFVNGLGVRSGDRTYDSTTHLHTVRLGVNYHF